MANYTKVPCAECGKMVEIPFTSKGKPQYCDKFCEARYRIKSKRNGRVVSTARPRRSPRRCRGCGG